MDIRGKRKKFIELVEKVMVRWGYTSTEGKIYGILLVSELPLTISDLLNLTNLSRTSISTSLKLLVKDGLVEVRREKRVKYFTPNPVFVDKFMKQPKELLAGEVMPLINIVDELYSSTTSEMYRKKLENIKNDLYALKKLLQTIIEMEERM